MKVLLEAKKCYCNCFNCVAAIVYRAGSIVTCVSDLSKGRGEWRGEGRGW